MIEFAELLEAQITWVCILCHSGAPDVRKHFSYQYPIAESGNLIRLLYELLGAVSTFLGEVLSNKCNHDVIIVHVTFNKAS